MKETEVERYVSDLLTVSGFRNDGAEHRLWVLLHHLYSAVTLWEQATDEERQVVEAMRVKLQYFFSAKIKLKETKRNKKENEKLPPTPPLKGKEKQKVKKNKKKKQRKQIFLLDASVRVLMKRRKKLLDSSV